MSAVAAPTKASAPKVAEIMAGMAADEAGSAESVSGAVAAGFGTLAEVDGTVPAVLFPPEA